MNVQVKFEASAFPAASFTGVVTNDVGDLRHADFQRDLPHVQADPSGKPNRKRDELRAERHEPVAGRGILRELSRLTPRKVHCDAEVMRADHETDTKCAMTTPAIEFR